MEGGPSEQELVKHATNMLLNAPPGEFMEVVTDVRALLPRESMLNDTALQTFKQYNEEQMIQVDSEDRSHKVLITKHGEIGDSQYFDYFGNAIVTFDHIKQEITASRPIAGESDPGMESLRAAIDAAVNQYVSEHFPFGTGAAYSSRADNAIVVCIASARFNPTNFWNGRWRSVWTIPVAKSGNVNMSGRLRIQVHYYEDGNVQLTTDTPKKVAVPASGDVNAFAQNVIKAISKIEQVFEQSLDTSYVTMGDNTFKALRRALPMNKQKINWNLIHGYRLGNDVSGAPSS